MSEMVERVARAICAASPRDWEIYRAEFEEEARAAIAAMREPTEAMLAIPDIAECEWLDIHQTDVPGLWRAIIDAALAD